MTIRNQLLSLAAGIAAGLPALTLSAQEPQSPPAPAQAAPPAKKDVESLIRELGSENYRTRFEAERALRERGDEAKPALQKAAEGSEDAEVQWRARRLLRQLDRTGTDELKQRAPKDAKDDGGEESKGNESRGQSPFRLWRSGAPGQDAMRDQFESLFERFERDFGLDVPRARFFDDSFFRDLQQQMSKAGARSQGMTMQIGPDGAVKVEVQEKGEDGKTETKTYEAPDLETFHQNHPGVLQRNGLGMGLMPGRMFHGGGMAPLRGFTFDWDGGMPGFQVAPKLMPRTLPRTDVELDEQPMQLEAMDAPAPPPPGKRLGVTIRPMSDDVRQYLGLDENVGLQVETVTEDSLAAALGLKPGDVVTSIAGASIGSPQDVQRALGPIAKGEDVEVKFVRKGAEHTAKAKKTESFEGGAADTKDEPTRRPGKLEKLEKRGKDTPSGGSEIR